MSLCTRCISGKAIVVLAIICFIPKLFVAAEPSLRGDSSRTEASPPLPASETLAVVSIFTYDLMGKPAFRSTGFFISEDGKLAVTRHGIEHTSRAFIQTHNGRKYAVTAILADDSIHDAAVVQVKGDNFPFLRLGSPRQVQVNEKVEIVNGSCDTGNDMQEIAPDVFAGPTFQGRMETKEATIVNVENLADDYRWVAVLAGIFPGNSGCPLVDPTGRVIGMLRAEFDNYTKGWVVTAETLQKLLDQTKQATPKPISELKTRPYEELFDDLNLKAAFSAARIGNNPDAVRNMRLAAVDFPESVVCYSLLGSYYSRLFMWKEANQAFTKAITLKPDYAFGWACLSAVLVHEGRMDDADKAVRKAEELGSSYPDMWSNVCITHLLLHQFDEARMAIHQLRQLKSPEAQAMANKLIEPFDIATRERR